MEKRQTAVDFLIDNIEIALKLNKVEINPIYRFKTIIPIFTMAKKMEREQIINSFSEGTRMIDVNDELSARFNACVYYVDKYDKDGDLDN
jgi:hypothetical protein